MANISSATGYITIMADSEEAMKALVQSFRLAEYWEYGTYGVEDGESEFDKDENKWTYSFSFDGSGRWNYENNASRHLIWCTGGGQGSLTPEEVETLVSSDFEIVYDFKDYECGCEFYCQELCRMLHRKGLPLEKAVFLQEEYEDLDMHWGVRLSEELEDEDYLIEFLSDYEASDIYSFIEEERDSLEEYFEMTLEEHAEEYFEKYNDSAWKDIMAKYKEGKKEASPSEAETKPAFCEKTCSCINCVHYHWNEDEQKPTCQVLEDYGMFGINFNPIRNKVPENEVIKIYGIDWDCSGADKKSLPKNVEVEPSELYKQYGSFTEDTIADYLSDTYEFCLNSYKVKLKASESEGC